MTECAEIVFQVFCPIVLALLFIDDSNYWLQLSSELIGDKKDLINVNEEQYKSDLYVNDDKLQELEMKSESSVITKHLWSPKLLQSVGRFDNKANFDRVIDQLSMTCPIIKKSEIKWIGDTNSSTIGFGSYSSVKKAIFRKNMVAIKSLYSFSDENYQYVVEFMREAYLSQRLRHQNIVEFRGVFVDRPNLCVVYEYMTHGNLFEYMTRDRVKYRNDTVKYYQSIPLINRIQFALDSAQGIAFLHSHNIIHRDINSMLYSIY